MADAGWRPPLVDRVRRSRWPDGGIATCEMMLVEHGRGGFISAHDYRSPAAAPGCAVARSTPTPLVG